jgi:putative hydrolase of the HAD superfamily
MSAAARNYSEAAQIRTVAFDMGGVLTYTSFGGLEEYGTRIGLPAGLLTTYFRGHPRIAMLETGAITSREFFKYVCIDAEVRSGVRLDIRELAAAAARGEELNPTMVDLVRQVGERYRTALLTNNVAEAGWRATFPFELFDYVVDSSEVGLRKPDPRIYEELIRRTGGSARELVFIDDLPENLEPARQLGITAIQFTGVADLRSALAEFGISP